MAMAMEPVRPAAEAAIGRTPASRDGASVQATRHLTKESTTAVTLLDKSHRYSTDGAATHHGRDDAA